MIIPTFSRFRQKPERKYRKKRKSRCETERADLGHLLKKTLVLLCQNERSPFRGDAPPKRRSVKKRCRKGLENNVCSLKIYPNFVDFPRGHHLPTSDKFPPICLILSSRFSISARLLFRTWVTSPQ